MATAHHAPRPTRLPASPRGRAGLVLSINGTRYAVRPIRPDDPGILRAFRLRKLGTPAAYVVALGPYGPTCECGDWTWRRDGTGTPCKHVAACTAVGLLDGPPARTPATPARVRDEFDD